MKTLSRMCLGQARISIRDVDRTYVLESGLKALLTGKN